jgi:hypothetical protein
MTKNNKEVVATTALTIFVIEIMINIRNVITMNENIIILIPICLQHSINPLVTSTIETETETETEIETETETETETKTEIETETETKTKTEIETKIETETEIEIETETETETEIRIGIIKTKTETKNMTRKLTNKLIKRFISNKNEVQFLFKFCVERTRERENERREGGSHSLFEFNAWTHSKQIRHRLTTASLKVDFLF